jgi:molybdopterin synthase catalytic subunit
VPEKVDSIKKNNRRRSGNTHHNNRKRSKLVLKRVTYDEIKPDNIIGYVKDTGAGTVMLFLGTVRDFGNFGKVEGMYYESYASMAEERLREIENEIQQKWPIKRAIIVHRIGELSVGDISMAVCISAPHRKEAIEACGYAVEKIKSIVPIWKKEKLANGKEAWVRGHNLS